MEVVKISVSQNKPSKIYNSIVRRAGLFDIFFMKNKAIDTMISGLKQPLTDLEKSSAFIYIGLLYADLKEYNKASEYFHTGLKIVEHQEFYYSPNFSKIIKIFIKNDELEKATYWLGNFNRRISFDKKFNKLGDINTYVKEGKKVNWQFG